MRHRTHNPLPLPVVAAALVGTAIATAAIASMNFDGANNSRTLATFWIGSAIAWATLTWVWQFLRTANPNPARFWIHAGIILAVAATARAAVIATSAPQLSDDIHRYVFDGSNLASGVNPYLPIPAVRAQTDEPEWPGEAEVAARVNNPELTTIYLPTSQWTFAAIASCIPDSVTDPLVRAQYFRAAFAVIDCAIIFCILLILRARTRAAWWACLYAWHPLTIAEIAGSGHQDVIGIAALLGALCFADCARTPRRWLWAPTLALAAMVKPVAFPAAAFFLRGDCARTWVITFVIGSITTAIVAGPLLLPGDGAPARALSSTTTTFSTKWSHFGSVYEPVLALHRAIEPIEDESIEWKKKDRQEFTARMICLGLMGLVFVLTLWRVRDHWAGARILLLSMVLFSTTAHPWYVLWALALMPIVPSPTLWVASLTLPLGYIGLSDPNEWFVPGWALVAAYVPVYSVLAIDLIRTRGSGGPGREPDEKANGLT